jgi:addiction module RelE/StbE family toxin
MTVRRFQVELSPTAITDLVEIHDFISQSAPLTADRLISKLYRRARSLSVMPYRGAHAHDLSPKDRSVRQLTISGYRLVYIVAGTRVLILHFAHAARSTTKRK